MVLKKFWSDFRTQAVTAVVAAFGFLIALSWREPISDLVNLLVERIGLTGESGEIYFKFLSAIVITVVAVLALMIVSGWKSKGEAKEAIKKNQKGKK